MVYIYIDMIQIKLTTLCYYIIIIMLLNIQLLIDNKGQIYQSSNESRIKNDYDI